VRTTAKTVCLAASLMLFAGTAHGAGYIVKPGDSLWTIASKSGTTVAAIKQANGMTSDRIYPGTYLNLSAGSYTVVNDESMWDIARKKGISLDALIRANPQVADPNNIWNGMRLNLPGGSAGPAAQKPQRFADGRFPLKKGTFELPLVNTFNDGRSWSPGGTTARKHEGVDIFADKGTPIYSALDGEIVQAGWNEYGGWRLTVRTDASTVFYYAHLNGYASGIAKGVEVAKGQLLGYVGSTGYGPVGTSGKFLPHLHFGMYRTSGSTWTAIDPFPYLQWWNASGR